MHEERVVIHILDLYVPLKPNHAQVVWELGAFAVRRASETETTRVAGTVGNFKIAVEITTKCVSTHRTSLQAFKTSTVIQTDQHSIFLPSSLSFFQLFIHFFTTVSLLTLSKWKATSE